MCAGFIIASVLLSSTLFAQAESSAFVIYGNGEASNGGDIKWRGAQIGATHDISEHAAFGAIYYNEGHPENNHRDGYALVAWYRQSLTQNLTAEVGTGPYYSMNTTNINGIQFNDKNLGALVALAIRYRLEGSNVYLRAQYNHVVAPGSFSTNTFLVGVQADMGTTQKSSTPSDVVWSLWVGPSHTTQSDASVATGYQLELQKRITENINYSVSAISEGNTILSNRKGVMGQIWYNTATRDGWRVDFGAGPYIAHDTGEGGNENKVLAVVSVRLNKEITKSTKVGVTFHRVVSGNSRDQDIFMIGVQSQF